MFVVLLKKTDYNTIVAAIDTKISTLDGKVTKNKNKLAEIAKDAALIFLRNRLFARGDGSQAYLIFQPVYRYFKFITGTNYISSQESKGLSNENIKSPTTSNNSVTPLITYYDYNIRIKFNGIILRQPKVTYTHKKS